MPRFLYQHLAVVALAAQSLAISAAERKTYCESTEVVVFSCTSRHRVISVCRSPDLSANAGYLQYRFGTAGKPPEFVYPTEKIHPHEYFKYVSEGGAKWSSDQLQFSVAAYEYVVFMERAAFDSNGGGVLVLKRSKFASALVCPREQVTDDLYSLEKFGIPRTEEKQSVQDALSKAGL